jgi:hypothetical protein
MIGLTEYSVLKNNICLTYNGWCDEYLLQLDILKPFIEKQKNISMFISCRDDKKILFPDKDYFIPSSGLSNYKFGFTYEITFDGQNHPIDNFLKLLSIDRIESKKIEKDSITNLCVLLTKGNYPTKNLNSDQIDFLTKIAKQKGYDVVKDQSVFDAGLVMGVESFDLFKSASLGIETCLFDTGLGLNLFKKMFPHFETISL